MLNSLGQQISDAFFASLDQAGCLRLDTLDSDSEGGDDMAPAAAAGAVSTSTATLTGFDRFQRHNPRTDRFEALRFHHVEFYCGDATCTYQRFATGLGMRLVAKSNQTTGNQTYCSYVLQSNDLVFVFTAPYSSKIDQSSTRMPHPAFQADNARRFFATHGLGVRAIGLLVGDAAVAYEESIANGAVGILAPQTLVDNTSQEELSIAEVHLYGDVVLRYISTGTFRGPFLPNYEPVESPPLCYGLTRLDHAVGNVPDLKEAIDYISRFTGFHDFAEFTAEDVGTIDSGLNSKVLASNNEMVILPVNEPTFGTKRKSQIQTYLEHNEGPGLQHLALKCVDIFATLREMRAQTHIAGFDFMPRPSDKYYEELPRKVGDDLTEAQLAEARELGLLVDKDDQGILLQIFTKPLGDRPTIFIEVIQRIGCMEKSASGEEYQRGGCGGFGKGNFSELFKSIEDYERTLDGVQAK
eukprot:SM000008S22170  [mRNA]  locus=s8:134648:137011:- [translate_table: standard]